MEAASGPSGPINDGAVIEEGCFGPDGAFAITE